MVDFLRKCVLHAIEFQAQQIGRVLDDKLKRFKDLDIQDSTIIRLHESLAKIWPAARTKKIAAGVKVSCIVSAVADSPKFFSFSFPLLFAGIAGLVMGLGQYLLINMNL